MDEKIISYIGVLLDISQNDFLEDHTRYMIEHDFLTGLPTGFFCSTGSVRR